MPSPSILLDRFVLGAAIVATAVLFSARLADPVNIIKMTALVLCAIALLTSCAVRAVRLRVIQLPWGAPAAVGIVLLVAFVLAAVTAPVTHTAMLGAYGRSSGLLTYGSALVLFLVGLRVLDRDGTRAVLYALMLAGAFTASYGLLQYAGIDAVGWNNPFNPIIAALGNPNFAAAYVAICAPAAAWGALRTGWGVPWRALSAVVLVLCLLAAVLSSAAQGPLAAALGLAVLVVAWLLDRSERVRRRGLVAVVTALGVVLALLAMGLAGRGPAASALGDIGTQVRRFYWRAALEIWREHPLFGVGLDTFGPFWRTSDAAAAAQADGLVRFTDAAHSVPLHLLATGGMVLFLAYGALVVLVATALVSGLRALRGEGRLLLGALGGSWVAYQVQSIVSIDQVPLIVTHYVLAAALLVAAGWARLREARLRGGVDAPATKTRKRPARPQVRPPAPSDAVALACLTLIAAALSWFAIVPLRAGAAAVRANEAAARGDLDAARAAYDRATALLPGESRYWREKGRLHQAREEPDLALQALLRAVRADPLDVDSAREAAVAAEARQPDEARRLRDRVRRLDPLRGANPA